MERLPDGCLLILNEMSSVAGSRIPNGRAGEYDVLVSIRAKDEPGYSIPCGLHVTLSGCAFCPHFASAVHIVGLWLSHNRLQRLVTSTPY